MNLEKIINYVHERGLWQSENCYETRCGIVKNMLIVANFFTYGTEEEKNICHDTVCIDIHKHDKFKGRLVSVEIHEITITMMMLYSWIFDASNFYEYKIDLHYEKINVWDDKE